MNHKEYEKSEDGVIIIIDYLRFRWGDAWYSYGYGYEAILETSPSGDRINWIIDTTPFIMDLSGREKKFMNLINDCHLSSWNGNRYINDFEDGVLWEITLGYSGNVNIHSEGINGFPIGFETFIKRLHMEWELPSSEIEKIPFPSKTKQYFNKKNINVNFRFIALIGNQEN